MSKDPQSQKETILLSSLEHALEGSNLGGASSNATEGSSSCRKPREATLHHQREPRPRRNGFQLYRSNVAEAKRNPAASLERNPNRAGGETGCLGKSGR